MTDVNIKELRGCCAANETVADNPILRHSERDHVTNGLGYITEIPSEDAACMLLTGIYDSQMQYVKYIPHCRKTLLCILLKQHLKLQPEQKRSTQL